MTARRAFSIYLVRCLVGIVYCVAALSLLAFGVVAVHMIFVVASGGRAMEVLTRVNYGFIATALALLAAFFVLVPLGAGLLIDWRQFSERVNSISETDWKSTVLQDKVISECLRVFRRRPHPR